MGFIICNYHGGNGMSFASKYHADKATNQEICIPSEVLRVHVIDKKKLFNGDYITDASVIKELGIENMTIDFQADQKKFETLLDSLEPVCCKCLDAYLNKE